MRLSAPSSWSPCQDPQQGRWRRVGRTLQTRSLRTRPRRSPAASPSTPPRSGGSPSPSWSPRGRPRRGTPVSWCRTGRNKPDQRNIIVILSLQRQHVQVRFVAMKINLPWDTWSHRGRGWSPRSPPQSQCQHTGLLAPFFFCKPTKSALTHLFGIKYLQHVTIRQIDLNCKYFL